MSEPSGPEEEPPALIVHAGVASASAGAGPDNTDQGDKDGLDIQHAD